LLVEVICWTSGILLEDFTTRRTELGQEKTNGLFLRELTRRDLRGVKPLLEESYLF